MKTPDLYLEMNCGIKIPVIQVQDKDGCPLNVAPVETLKLLENGSGKIFTKESTDIDSNIFYYADAFERTDKMILEIKSATDIQVNF